MSDRVRELRGWGRFRFEPHDVERAADFYEKVLGLKLLFKAPPGLAFFDCGGVRLMLDHPEKPEFDHASSILYFAVPDIKAAHAAHEGQGCEASKTSPTCSLACPITICG